MLKYLVLSRFRYCILQGASNKDVDQTVLMHMPVCTIDVRIQQNQVLSQGSFSYFSTITYVVGTEKNRLNETVLLRKTYAI